MHVSGAGSAYTPQRHSAAAERPAPVVTEASQPHDELGSLTADDRELIRQVFADGSSVNPASGEAFAACIAAERAAGRLLPGQRITVLFLKDLDRRYARTGGPNPIAAHLDRAFAYLARTGASRVDVTA